MSHQDNTRERERLENDLFDAEIVANDLADQILPHLLELREAKRRRRVCRARLARFEFIESVRDQFGDDMAAMVDREAARV